MHLQMSSAKWRQYCLGLNVLTLTLTGSKAGVYSFAFVGQTKKLYLELWSHSLWINLDTTEDPIKKRYLTKANQHPLHQNDSTYRGNIRYISDSISHPSRVKPIYVADRKMATQSFASYRLNITGDLNRISWFSSRCLIGYPNVSITLEIIFTSKIHHTQGSQRNVWCRVPFQYKGRYIYIYIYI